MVFQPLTRWLRSRFVAAERDRQHRDGQQDDRNNDDRFAATAEQRSGRIAWDRVIGLASYSPAP
jgi:hypothetical protein